MHFQAQRRTGGTGLGLYSLSKRMESLGGNCGVADRSDGASGSCFWITIPFKPDESVVEVEGMSMRSIENSARTKLDIHAEKNPTGRVASTDMNSLMSGFIHRESDGMIDVMSVRSRAQHSGLKILLVDDSNLIRKATGRSLAAEGYHVEVAQHGAE